MGHRVASVALSLLVLGTALGCSSGGSTAESATAGSAGAGNPGSPAAGSGGAGTAGRTATGGGSGSGGSGIAGAGTPGATNAGAGTAGAGNAGTGNAGTGNAGTGNAGTGNAGTGNAGTGNAGTGNAGTGSAGSGGAGAAGSNPNSVGLTLVKLPGGTFTMGTAGSGGHAEESPAHSVTLSPFSISTTEVPFQSWSTMLTWGKSHGYTFDTDGTDGYNPTAPPLQNPIVNLTWWDSLRWCNALSEMEGRTPAYYTDSTKATPYRGSGQPDFANDVVLWSGNGYRLPTEAEWEYAYRGGTSTLFWWGDTFDASKEWVDPTNGCAVPSHPVASKTPNPFGLYDMGGNVHEMIWDSWPSPYSSGSVTDPHGAGSGGWARVTRGGNLCYDQDYARAAFRRGVNPAYTLDFDEGFRVVLPQ